MEHFVKSNENGRVSTLRLVVACILMIPTLGVPFWLMYEYFFENHYWKNRWRLNRLLNKGKVKVTYLKTSDIMYGNIDMYSVVIDNKEYSLWIWDNESMTLGEIDNPSSDYIGLFTGSMITRWLNKSAIKELQLLANENK
jgi:hypothetical protein